MAGIYESAKKTPDPTVFFDSLPYIILENSTKHNFRVWLKKNYTQVIYTKMTDTDVG